MPAMTVLDSCWWTPMPLPTLRGMGFESLETVTSLMRADLENKWLSEEENA